MAKHKKNRKKKRPQQAVKIKPATYIRQHARKSPIYECLIDKDWKETKFSPVIVARKKASGRLIMGFYLVDLQCLGVKNSRYYHDMSEEQYRELVAQMSVGMEQHFITIDPTLCFNIIYGAVEFAEDCGFYPHKDFEVSEYILDDVATIDYVEVPFGDKDGKPFFVAGPDDNSAKIMATLKKNKGEGNFEFIANITPDTPIYKKDMPNELLFAGGYFPEDLVRKKIATVSSDDFEVFHLQLNTASLVMKHAKGDIAYIKEQYNNPEEEDFFDDLFEQFLLMLEEMTEEPEEFDLSPEEEKHMENHLAWIIEKIIEFEGPQFLWSAEYEPQLNLPVYDNLEELTEEEWDAMEQKKVFYMTKYDKEQYYLSRVFLNLTAAYSKEELASKEVQANLLDEFLTTMEEKVFKDTWNEEYKDYCLDIAKTTLEKLEHTFKEG